VVQSLALRVDFRQLRDVGIDPSVASILIDDGEGVRGQRRAGGAATWVIRWVSRVHSEGVRA
jgi:hypothetical protein